jgi:hypothetical protein
MRRGLSCALATVAVLAIVGLATPASAHEGRHIKGYDVVVGWLGEPAYAGFQNAVQFVAEKEGEGPAEGAELTVVVVFGGPDGQERTDPLPLEPAFGAPGEYHATILPTRPGSYTFLVSGTLGPGVTVEDEAFTSGPDTFGDIGDPAEIQFPVKDPAIGELGELVDRVAGRVDEASSVADQAKAAADEAKAAVNDAVGSAQDEAASAKTFAYVSLAVAVVAVVLAIVAMTRGRRTPEA